MRYLKGVFILATLIFLISLFFVFPQPLVMDKTMGDIDGDGSYEEIVLTRRPFNKYGKEVVIYSFEGTEIFREDFSELKPWKVAGGDVDGDGVDEISIGVYKETLFHPVMDKRPFIYYYKENRLHPKWRGSRLSKPFTDYLFFDIDKDGMDEIISIERLNNGDKVINTYKWTGFGFESLSQSKGYNDILRIYLDENLIYAEYKENSKKHKGILYYYDNNLKIERVISSD